MNTLFVIENANLRGGTEIQSLNLLHALRAAGEDVWLLSLIPYEGEDEHVLSLSEEEHSKWTRTANKIWNKLTFSIFSDCILRKILRKKIKDLQPSILVNQTYDIITALPTGNRVAQVFHWSIVGYEASLKSNINKKGLFVRYLSIFCEFGRRFRRHRILSRISKLIVLSNAATGELKTLNTKVRDEQITVIPNFLRICKDSHTLSSLKNENVVFVGRLSHEKGVMRLLRIWKLVSHELPHLKLSIYGEGTARSEMETYIRKENLQNVVFCGFCKSTEDIYMHADLLLMTSDTEGFGLVLIEAMYYGVPCVSFDCPISPKEIIADAGITIPCFDEETYAQKIVETLSDEKFLMTLQHKAICRARDFYLDKIIEKWRKLETHTICIE